ncbi:hypothetical protein QQS21_002709 [Conoideocrella luteorostrata]|uniref:Uncharacterized protein n=1 Tax=Conoideocrella luteorostrata TaxID=1105319 RepID=A0AAJ0G106_9HYPO|nr:hypothetical protein QQS21_002709 [Conoideocrella luteorostrata]
MAILGWLKKPAAAAEVSDTSDWDEYPVHLMDGSKLNHKVFGWTMRFNDVLDADMLHSALTRLLEIGDWRKLGGRLRQDKNGQLRIVVPKTFSSSHPAVEYKHSVHSQSITAHAVGAQFLSATAEPSIQPLDQELRHLMAPDDYPEAVDGLLQKDKPQLSLFINSFNDATLVSIAFPHTLLDTSSFTHLVQNWSLVLGGRDSEVPPLLDAYKDAVEDLIQKNSHVVLEESRLEKMRLKGFGYWKLLARHVADAAQRKRRLQALYIPRDTYQRLLEKLGQESSGHDKPNTGNHISEQDLLTAWMIRTIAAQESSPRPVTLITLYNLRDYSPTLKQAGRKGNFAQNMPSSTCALFPSDATQKSVAEIAKSYNDQMTELTSEDEMVAYLRQVRQELTKEKPSLALYGSTDALVVFANPLAQLDLTKMADFGPAVKSPVEEQVERLDRRTPPGRIVANVFNSLNWTDAGIDSLFPLGGDYEGGCWVAARLSAASWSSLFEELRAL